MTWDELEKCAEELGASVSYGGWIEFGKITFWKDGALEVFFENDVMEIADDRTPDQMYAIMEALK